MLRYIVLFALAVWAASHVRQFTDTNPQAGDPTPVETSHGSRTPPPPSSATTPRASPPLIEDVTDATVVDMHRWYVKDFLAQDGFGRRRIIDFEDFPRNRVEIGGRPHCMVKRRLIGAWRHDQPRLYEPYTILSKRNLQATPWSELDAIDAAALKKLEGGSEIVINAEHARVVGALRAKKACLECHDVKRGTVLGALRYDFEPIGRANPMPIELVPKSYQGRAER